MKRTIILFDINETVLNLSALKPKFKATFGDESVMATWFSMLLHSSTVCIMTSVKTDFATLAGTMLESIAARMSIKLSKAARDDILAGFANLPPHNDIKPALAQLKSAGFRTVAFSNSSLNLISTQITNAGLKEYFDDIISVEETGSFKPDPTVYKFAAKRLNQPLESLRLVATHDWDTHGALSVEMRAAYINRSGAVYHPLYRQPDIYATTMEDIVKLIIEKDD
ncbi:MULTISPECIES: haloacid dehalogenase type II [Colwellia]|uniref:(S)-2-haloacid dehalogenase n=1 Tax=Colwellia psychrerythraea (strain 34H / ATCC BAA-681) TaxID=167879 RepID=Q47ZE3_COLP3|nr:MULTISPECIES: haloacid dehalogenase type II [Colwellia]AAZ25662.1 haloacid dehalogenase, type II [Colwellia psychrerythraea 34H]PKH87166.1 haloacid dehalogenase type II [Colwellia sp. Bg11-28]